MTPHADILDAKEPIGRSLIGSVALHVGLGRRATEHVRVGVDEGQILALLFGEAIRADTAHGA